MIKNKNLDPDSRVRHGRGTLDISTGTIDEQVLAYDSLRDIKIRKVTLVYVTASDTDTHREVRVGITGALSKYVAQDTVNSQAIGTVVEATLLSTDLVAAGTPLLLTGEVAAAANTAKVDVIVEYELVDRHYN